MKDKSETHMALSNLIKASASCRSSLNHLEGKITRHYNAGTISASQLAKLDEMIMLRLARLD